MNWIKGNKKLCLCLVVVALFLGWRAYDSRFTPERWAAADPYRERGKLVRSLLDRYDGLVGMTREEVVSLSGEDTNGEQREERLTPEGSETVPMLVYPVGGRPWAMFPEYLFVYLEDGRVARAELIAD